MIALVLAPAAARVAQAQTGRVHVGPHVTYNFDIEKIGLGAQLGIPLANLIDFYPSFDVFLVDVGSFAAFNADLKLRPAPVTLSPLYLGAGLNLSRAGFEGHSNTDTNLNLFGGLEGRTGAVHPFAELRAIVGNGSTVQLSAGVNFTLGRPGAVVR
jgi:hypothetical protein